LITDERIVTYLHSLEQPNSEFLQKMELYAKEHRVPIIRKEMESFLRVILTVKRPLRVLEVGTAIGYSGILMAEYLPEGGTLTTIENYEPRIAVAKENIEASGYTERITLLEGDAMEILPTLAETYDFVFMDAAKGQYLNFFPEILRLLSPGGILVSDNVLQEGELVESRFAVTRRDRTIHSRMREYLHMLKNHPQLLTSIVPIGDGITMSVKVSEN